MLQKARRNWAKSHDIRLYLVIFSSVFLPSFGNLVDVRLVTGYPYMDK